MMLQWAALQEEVIAQDVQRIIDVGDSMGLHLNIYKCEIISSPNFLVSDVTLKSLNLAGLHCSWSHNLDNK